MMYINKMSMIMNMMYIDSRIYIVGLIVSRISSSSRYKAELETSSVIALAWRLYITKINKLN